MTISLWNTSTFRREMVMEGGAATHGGFLLTTVAQVAYIAVTVPKREDMLTPVDQVQPNLSRGDQQQLRSCGWASLVTLPAIAVRGSPKVATMTQQDIEIYKVQLWMMTAFHKV